MRNFQILTQLGSVVIQHLAVSRIDSPWRLRRLGRQWVLALPPDEKGNVACHALGDVS